MIVLDTTILVCAVGAERRAREPSRRLLDASALSHEADALVSADRTFASMLELRYAVPGSPAFESLVARKTWPSHKGQ